MKNMLMMLLFMYSLLNADVIFPFYSSDPFVAGASVENIFSYEKKLTKSLSVMPWSGVAVFWPFYQYWDRGPAIPALGLEGALEFRSYPFRSDLSGLFVGLYGGGAFMFPAYAAFGTSIGIKAGYKKAVKSTDFYRFCLEPYGSISTLPAVYTDGFYHNEWRNFPGVILTAGLRLVSQWGKYKN